MSLAQTNYGALPMRAESASRRTVSFRPVTEGASYGPGSVLRIPISSIDFADPLCSHLNGRFALSYTGGVAGSTENGGLCLPMSFESLIDYAIVRCGGRVIDDVREYSIISSIVDAVSQSTDSVRSIGAICTGQTLTDEERLVKFNTAGTPVPHPMNDAYFSIDLSCLALWGTNKNYIPVRYLAARQSIELEIRFKQLKDTLTYFKAVDGSASAPANIDWSISEVFFQTDALDMAKTTLMWDQKILSRPMVYPQTSITHYSMRLPESSTNFTQTFSHPGEDLRTVVVSFSCDGLRNAAAAATPLSSSDMLWMPPFLQEASLQVGTRRFPETDRLKFIWKGSDTAASNIASSAPMAYREMVKAFGRSSDQRTGYIMTPDLFTKNKDPDHTAPIGMVGDSTDYRTTFAICFNLDSNPHDSTPDVAGTGISTLSATTHQLTMGLHFSAARGAYNANTNPFGGDYTINIHCFTRENLLIFADRVEREIKLVLPAGE